VPYNPDRIPKEAYLPSTLYCQSSQAVTEVAISVAQESMQLACGVALNQVSANVVCDVSTTCENIICTIIELNEDLSRVPDEPEQTCCRRARKNESAPHIASYAQVRMLSLPLLHRS